MMILAIDPGDTMSAWVLFDTKRFTLLEKAKDPNEELLKRLTEGYFKTSLVVIEYPAPRGQPMYSQLVDTIFWIGRYVQALNNVPYELMDRKDVKMELCGNTRSNDSHIRAAVLSRFPSYGGGRIGQVGTKKAPGPLFGVSSDIWAALAIAIAWTDIHNALDSLLD